MLKKNYYKSALQAGIILTITMILLSLWLRSCRKCESYVIDVQQSISKKYELITIRDNCHATIPFVYKVILKEKNSWINGDIVFKAIRINNLHAKWSSNNEIMITYVSMEDSVIFEESEAWHSSYIWWSNSITVKYKADILVQ